MIQYFFDFDRENHLINIELNYDQIETEHLSLNLPLWRPGRYQAQNFPKNILNFEALSDETHLQWKKTTTHSWKINTKGYQHVKIKYSYYANEVNAGTSWVNDGIIYINPVNLTMFRKQDMDQKFSVTMKVSGKDIRVSSGLDHSHVNDSILFQPDGYFEFFDSPILVSNQLDHLKFNVLDIPFNFWIYGKQAIDTDRMIADLKKVAEYQINLFGRFPEQEYHFQLVIPPHSYYHGVEHRNSTMMVLSDNGVLTEESYTELLGLASHELFHTWNILKIRPKELLPYDYTRENYFETCFVAEGYTTYFGDRILYDSGVFNKDQYRHELETVFKRHFDKNDQASQSLLESSFDLWVDGYDPGTPNKKVSVYHKGAITALILDVMIRKKFDNKKSLEDVVRQLFQEFGDLSEGYTYDDIVRICEEVYEDDLSVYFDKFIAGSDPVLGDTAKAVSYLGMQLFIENSSIRLEIKD